MAALKMDKGPKDVMPMISHGKLAQRRKRFSRRTGCKHIKIDVPNTSIQHNNPTK